MKKGFLLLTLLTVASFAFADITTVSAVKEGEKVNVTISWTPEMDYGTVLLRGNYDGDQWGTGKAMTRDGNTWTLVITGKAIGDSFEYKFFADDEWQDAEENYPSTVGNPFGGVNGFVAVDAGLLAGTLTKAFAPKINVNFYQPTRFIFTDPYSADATVKNNTAEFKWQNYFKVGGEALPNLFFWTEINLHGAGGVPGNSGGNKTLWSESNTDAQNAQLLMNFSDVFFRGISAWTNGYVNLQKFFVEYQTPFVNVAYSDGYYKPVPESFGSQYYYQVYGVDGTKDANSLMGNIRLMKAGLELAEGISLDYLVTMGAGARKTYNDAIWSEGVVELNYAGNTYSMWDENKFGLYGMRSLVNVKLPGLMAGFVLNQVSQAVAGSNSRMDDYFTKLNTEFGLGVKGSAGMVSYVGQFLTHMFAPKANGGADVAYKFGNHSAIAAKATFDLAPITLTTALEFVGNDFKSDRFYSDSFEDKGGVYANSNAGFMIFQLDPKFNGGDFWAGAEIDVKLANPLLDPVSTNKDLYTDYKLYGGYNLSPSMGVDGYIKLKFNAYEVATGKNSFELNTVGVKYWMNDVVPDVMKNLTAFVALTNDGTGTTATTDDNIALSFLLTSTWASDTETSLGINFVTPDEGVVVAASQSTFGLGLGVRQAFEFDGRKNIDKFQVFGQIHMNQDIFDNDEKGQFKLSDYRIDKAGTGLMSVYTKFVLGVLMDY